MHDTIPHPPERTATVAERADHSARTERACTGQQRPRTLHALCEQAAVLVPCGHCWARPGAACVTGPAGYHLARFGRARRRGLLTEAELAAVLDKAGVFTNATVIRDGAR